MLGASRNKECLRVHDFALKHKLSITATNELIFLISQVSAAPHLVFIYSTHAETSLRASFTRPACDDAGPPGPIHIAAVYNHVCSLYASALGPCGMVMGGGTRPPLWPFGVCVCKFARTHTVQYVYTFFQRPNILY